jgi:hypothetical protein
MNESRIPDMAAACNCNNNAAYMLSKHQPAGRVQQKHKYSCNCSFPNMYSTSTNHCNIQPFPVTGQDVSLPASNLTVYNLKCASWHRGIALQGISSYKNSQFPIGKGSRPFGNCPVFYYTYIYSSSWWPLWIKSHLYLSTYVSAGVAP